MPSVSNYVRVFDFVPCKINHLKNVCILVFCIDGSRDISHVFLTIAGCLEIEEILSRVHTR